MEIYYKLKTRILIKYCLKVQYIRFIIMQYITFKNNLKYNFMHGWKSNWRSRLFELFVNYNDLNF